MSHEAGRPIMPNDPFLFRPSSSTPIQRVVTADVAAGATVRLLGLRLTSSEFFRLHRIGFGGDSNGLVTFDQLDFSLRVNGVRHPALGQISDQIGTIAELTDVDIRIIESGSLIEVFCTNNDGVDTARVSARWVGWTFPREVWERYFGGLLVAP